MFLVEGDEHARADIRLVFSGLSAVSSRRWTNCNGVMDKETAKVVIIRARYDADDVGVLKMGMIMPSNCVR